MHFMRTIGIHQEGHLLYIAHLEDGRLLETRSELVDVKPLDIPLDAHTITGLGFDEVLCRELHMKLRRHRQIFAALPFQAEGVIPYPLAEAIIYPELLPSSKEPMSFC